MVLSGSLTATAADLPQMVDLGRALFHDPDLSRNGDQACAFCHDPATGFAGPLATVNGGGAVYEGSVAGRFGNRRPPTAAYVSPGPVFHHVMEDGGVLFVGGAFLDGRASGGLLGQLSSGDTVPEFEQAMDALQPGELSKPVRSPFGWHLILMEERRVQDVSADRKRAAARNALRERKLDEAYQDWLRQLRDRAYVEYRLDQQQ